MSRMSRRGLLAALLGGLTLLGGAMYRSEDLAPLIAPDTGEPGVIRAGQGVVLEWNPDTGENLIRYRGTDLRNLPIVASSTEILALKPGDVVMLHLIGAAGASTAYIVGRVSRPGPEVAELIQRVLSTNTYSATVATMQSTGPTSPATFVDLATPGPTLANIPIRNGRCLVTVSAHMSHPGAIFAHASMGFQISGATSRGANLDQSLQFTISNESFVLGASRTFLIEGLNSGLHTFTAKYANGSASGTASWENRTITVIAF